jgi:geranylgeranyl diphosphate synthase type II
MDQEFLNTLESERQIINKHIIKLFNDVIAEDDEPFLRKFFKSDLDFLLRGGRRILPISLINTFRGISSDRDIAEYIEEIYRIAISVEMMHIGTLIHDDYIDHETVRSGNPTFHIFMHQNFKEVNVDEFENATAIYGGSLTSFLGTKILANNATFDEARKNRAILSYINGLNAITRGHLLEVFLSNRPLDEVTLEDYLILADYKRGKQMATAVELGAILGNARESQLEPLAAAMSKIGIIDQMTNDLKGSFGDPKLKSIDGDIKRGQKTILTIIANQTATPSQKKILKNILGKIDATPEEVQQVRDIFLATGAVDFTKQYAVSLKVQAINNLDTVYPGLRKENELFFYSLMDYLLESPV